MNKASSSLFAFLRNSSLPSKRIQRFTRYHCLREYASRFHINWRLGGNLIGSCIDCLFSLLMLNMIIVLVGTTTMAVQESLTDEVERDSHESLFDRGLGDRP